MHINQEIKLHNKFEFTVVDAITGKEKQKAYAYNVITDNYFKCKLLSTPISSTSNLLSYIAIGTGTGTPSIADSKLFTHLTRKEASVIKTVYDYPTSYISKRIKIEATECNDSTITEVGFEGSYRGSLSIKYYLMTHAMLQASEGNQIAINKTDTDVVYVKAIFYVTYTASGFGDNGIYPEASKNYLVQWLLTGSTDSYVRIGRLPLTHSSDLSDDYTFYKRYSFNDGTGNMDTLQYDLPEITLLDSEANNMLIKHFGISGIGAFSFPDASVFPDYAIDHLVLGEGDGETTEFNIKCPLIKAETIRVFVNSEELSSEEFEADYDSNCVDVRENYYTASMNCQMENVVFGDLATREASTSNPYQDPLFLGTYVKDGYLYPSSCYITETNPVWIDFGVAKDCNRLKIDNRSVSTTYLNRMVIQYSDDNENWTTLDATREDTSVNSNLYCYTWKWSLTKARYWRFYISDYSWSYRLYYDSPGTRDNNPDMRASCFLGKSVPGLKLKTAPASNEIVEVSYAIDVPFKTSNNLLRMTCSIQLQRG